MMSPTNPLASYTPGRLTVRPPPPPDPGSHWLVPRGFHWLACDACGQGGWSNVPIEQAAAHHVTWCATRQWERDLRARGFDRVNDGRTIFEAAGVTIERAGPGCTRWAPVWALLVADAKVAVPTGGTRAVPYHRRLRLLRRLAGDPVAQQLVASHPHTIAALLAAS